VLFENYGQEVGGPIHCWSRNLKVGAQSPPVPMVVAPMSQGVAIGLVVDRAVRGRLDTYSHSRREN